MNRLRAFSTLDSATSVSSSGNSRNAFKLSGTKYRYSKDEILALRVNISERLDHTIQDEIMKNLKDVEDIFRPKIFDPLSLTTPTPEETVNNRMFFSFFIENSRIDKLL